MWSCFIYFFKKKVSLWNINFSIKGKYASENFVKYFKSTANSKHNFPTIFFSFAKLWHNWKKTKMNDYLKCLAVIQLEQHLNLRALWKYLNISQPVAEFVSLLLELLLYWLDIRMCRFGIKWQMTVINLCILKDYRWTLKKII